MKKQTPCNFSSERRVQITFEATKSQLKRAKLSKKSEVNPIIILSWKPQLLGILTSMFGKHPRPKGKSVDVEKQRAQIYIKKSCMQATQAIHPINLTIHPCDLKMGVII